MDRPLPRASDVSQSEQLKRAAAQADAPATALAHQRAHERATERASALADALTTLQDPCVRDLAWLLLAPRLLSAHAFGSLLVAPPEGVADLLDALRKLDTDPSPLHQTLAPLTTRRVGHYAERLVHFALSAMSSYTLIAANLPLRLHKQTVGECDFLLEDPAGVRLHWELAVKCYLRVDPNEIDLPLDDSLAAFVGPALGDRLDIKLARMLDHQLPLSGRADYAALLPPGPWQAQMWISGWLFDRFDHWYARRPMQMDPRLAADLSTGFWVPASQWHELAAMIGAQGWTQLPRLRWIAPLARPDASFCDEAGMSARIADAFLREPSLNEAGDSEVSIASHDASGVAAAQAMTRERIDRSGGASEPAADVMPGAALGYVPRARTRDDPFAIAAWKQGADGRWVECARGFVVADDWEPRARVFAAS